MFHPKALPRDKHLDAVLIKALPTQKCRKDVVE